MANNTENEQNMGDLKIAPNPKANAAPKKGGKIALKTVKGMRDREPTLMAVQQRMFRTIVDTFERHDAEELDTPTPELKEILTGKYGEEGAKLIYDLADQGGESAALRYDFTVPFARYMAQNKLRSMRRYQIGKVYRRDQPAMTRGRYREFYQCDFDIAGEYDVMSADAEVLVIVDEVLSALTDVGPYVIKVNHRLLLDGLFTSCGVPDNLFRTIMSAVDKLDKCQWSEVRKEMVEKGLDEEVADRVKEYVCRPPAGPEAVEELLADSLVASSEKSVTALKELQILFGFLANYGVVESVRFDLGLARGLDYYTGLIYEAVLTEGVPGDSGKGGKGGESVGVGSVAGGGRYDELVGMFSGRKVPCIGVSFGVERLLTVMEARAKKDGRKIRTSKVQVYVCNAHKGLLDERMAVCAELWKAGFYATHSGKANSKLLNQFQACEEKGIPLAVILGDSELKEGKTKVRIISTREERDVARSDLLQELRKDLEKATAS